MPILDWHVHWIHLLQIQRERQIEWVVWWPVTTPRTDQSMSASGQTKSRHALVSKTKIMIPLTSIIRPEFTVHEFNLTTCSISHVRIIFHIFDTETSKRYSVSKYYKCHIPQILFNCFQLMHMKNLRICALTCNDESGSDTIKIMM